MLNSMPQASPPTRRPLKRSASTASLPTPPRTHHKHARGRSRGSCDSDSDENAVLTSDDDNEEIEAGIHKKRRTGEATEDNEEAFWLGDSAGLNSVSAGSSSKSSSSSKIGVPLLYRRLLAQTETDVAPVSPPPSHRKAAVVVSPVSDPELTDSPSPPHTPRTRSQTKKALRDSPDNPFLVSPQKQIDAKANSATKKPPTHQERPEMIYVFRGVRRVFHNPLYNHQEGRAYSPPPASKLPLDDPEYSPALNCPPKLLFPEARHDKGKKPVRNRRRSPSLSDDGDDELDLNHIRPKLLDFGPPKKAKNTQTLDQEFKSAGETLSI